MDPQTMPVEPIANSTKNENKTLTYILVFLAVAAFAMLVVFLYLFDFAGVKSQLAKSNRDNFIKTTSQSAQALYSIDFSKLDAEEIGEIIPDNFGSTSDNRGSTLEEITSIKNLEFDLSFFLDKPNKSDHLISIELSGTAFFPKSNQNYATTQEWNEFISNASPEELYQNIFPTFSALGKINMGSKGEPDFLLGFTASIKFINKALYIKITDWEDIIEPDLAYLNFFAAEYADKTLKLDLTDYIDIFLQTALSSTETIKTQNSNDLLNSIINDMLVPSLSEMDLAFVREMGNTLRDKIVDSFEKENVIEVTNNTEPIANISSPNCSKENLVSDKLVAATRNSVLGVYEIISSNEKYAQRYLPQTSKDELVKQLDEFLTGINNLALKYEVTSCTGDNNFSGFDAKFSANLTTLFNNNLSNAQFNLKMLVNTENESETITEPVEFVDITPLLNGMMGI